ncbi:VOC family protein [Alkalihalobacillus sp. LMS6]|uniref:VOC family protein n=1 Tax=Bacillaceae TaxID=186817 RepID=UPI0020D02F24|nr:MULTISPECIES: VOC family protein [Bacillaceae]UTR07015.1 VOC family protein [Alkalihalobacillus sp. LMS6]
MKNQGLVRVGTIYLPVVSVDVSADWYIKNLCAELSYKDEEKAILNVANLSVFLVKSHEDQTANFYDCNGAERFSVTFEVDGLHALEALHNEYRQKGVKVGDIESRGHAGKNFVFYDLDGNLFDVWSELSPSFKED